ISHDFNNVLGIIIGYSELLKNSLADQSQLLSFVNQIHTAGERGAKLTKKLLSFSRKTDPEASNLDINKLILEQQDMLQKTLTVRVKLQLNLVDEIWPVWLDDSDLEDAVLNICINAMHAMDETKSDDQLTISTCNKSVNSADAHVLDIKVGDYVQLIITDTGCGMDNSTKDKIFDPFYSTKGDRGTGLGLSQVFGFVKRAGGTIKVYSELGLGSQFVLYFPRFKDDEQQESNDILIDDSVFRGYENILVVDDEEGLRVLVSEIFKDKGYQIFCAADAKEALQVLEKQAIDLIISDIIMPGMDGYQLAAIVKEKYPEVKIQLASGFADARNIDKVDKALFKNMIHKPYDSQILLQKARELLDG
ncbi:MAG: hybrid sensor histidine kinase/response regulator, partial [Gammaproteobacteria bacterium]